MDEKKINNYVEEQKNTGKKAYIITFFIRFLILCLILFFTYAIVSVNYNPQAARNDDTGTYQFLTLLFGCGGLVVAFVPLFLMIDSGIACVISKRKMFSSIIISILIFLGIVAYIALLRFTFVAADIHIFTSSNNYSKKSSVDGIVQKYCSDDGSFVPLVYLDKNDAKYDEFINFLDSKQIRYRDDRDFAGFKIVLTKNMKLIMYKYDNSGIRYVSLDHYLNKIRDPKKNYGVGYYVDYNNGGVPNIRMRIDKYEEKKQSLRIGYYWYTFDSDGNLLHYCEYGV